MHAAELLSLLPFVDAGEPIPSDMMLRLMNGVQDGIGSEARRSMANEILSGAGDYLPGRGYLSHFISGKLSRAEADEIIIDRKRYLGRMRHLLPSILRIVGARDERNLRSSLLRIDDCCHDFLIVLRSAHEKKIRKAIRADVGRVRAASSELHAALEKAGRHIDIEYEQHSAVLFDNDQHPSAWDSSVEVLKQLINCLRVAADIALYRDEIGEDGFYVENNKARTHIVECAYSIAIWCGTPSFVTTPGSDFSLLCSLLFELAGGEQDASLAGAINKFARSALRRKLDADEAESRWENSDDCARAHEADNFLYVASNTEKLTHEALFWKTMMESRTWDDVTKFHIGRRLLERLEQIRDARQRHGPYQVWHDPINEGELESFAREARERDAALLELEIEVGRKKRAVDLILTKQQKTDQHGGPEPE